MDMIPVRIFWAIELVINLVFGTIELLLGFRFLLKLLGANLSAPFVAWVYENSQTLLQLFNDMFSSQTLEGRFVIEFNVLFAIVIYALIDLVLVALIRFLSNLFNPKK